MTSESSQPEDYSSLVETQDKGRNYLFYIVIIAFVLVLVWYFTSDTPEQEIELEAPQSHQEIDPVIRAQIDAAKQPVTADRQQKQQPEGANVGLPPSAVDTSAVSTAPASSLDIAALQADRITTKPVNAGETARLLINSVRQGEKDLTLEQLFAQAAEHQNQAMSTDAYLLYFFAARKGHGPSAFELAKMHDPAHFEAGSELLDEPDPVQAYKWYSVAVESNTDGAKEKLQTLRSSIEAAAQSGDLSAQRLLLNWK